MLFSDMHWKPHLSHHQFPPLFLSSTWHQLYVFQRTPNWVSPKPDLGVSIFWRYIFPWVPLSQQAFRWFLYFRQEWTFFVNFVPARWTSKIMHFALRFMIRHFISSEVNRVAAKEAAASGNPVDKVAVTEKVERLITALTPDYLPGCKRILQSNDFYPAICRSNVELLTQPLQSIKANVVVVGGQHVRSDGSEVEAKQPVQPRELEVSQRLESGVVFHV